MKKLFLFIALHSMLFWLSACTPPRFPIELTALSISPEPIVGRLATLHVEAKSDRNEPDARIVVTLPEEIKLVKGSLSWRGSLVANRPQTHELSICVLREGEWRIWIAAASRLSPSSSYGDSEILNIRSTTQSAQVIPGSKYRAPIWPQFGIETPTPAPVTVSPECSGQQQ